ncbi:response regulator transcription factor [Marilutibacter penaei]|uniref:response regulator transcription factor n=1 Tax=Marilutibacter penaei TaxID=2759900 RepID=UPI0031B5B402
MGAQTEPKASLRVALLEDDRLLRERVLEPGLRNFGFTVTSMETAAELDGFLRSERFDLLVLDVGLPDSDGFTVVRQVRASHPAMGVVMLTGRNGTPDRVRGLSDGADAYLAKPVELDLLAATLYSVARRLEPPVAPRADGWQLMRGGWVLSSPEGAEVALTEAERRVLDLLARHDGEIVQREDIIASLTDNVHDYDPHRLDSLLHRLRRKVERVAGCPLPLSAAHGRGYVLALGA